MAVPRSHGKQVTYMTGAPATGKTTVCDILRDSANVTVFGYGALLTARTKAVDDQVQLRSRSSQVIAPSHVVELDHQLAVAVASTPQDCVIDSHAVTIERRGTRAVPYSPSFLRAPRASAVVCLTVKPHVIAARIAENPSGRPVPDRLDLRMHQDLQMNLATTYAHMCGAPAYLIRAEPAADIIAATARQVCRLDSGSAK